MSTTSNSTAPTPKAGILDKAWVALLFSTVPALSLWWIPKSFFVGNKQNILVYLVVQMRKYISRNVSFTQMRWLKPVNSLAHDLETRSYKMEAPNFNKEFPVEGAAARWLVEAEGRTRSDPVVLYLHGGAYCMTTYATQIKWCVNFARKFERLSVLAVDYTVTPIAKYPTQLNEALAVYKELQKSCDRIVVLGDSAGGHLAATLQKHLDENSIAKPLGVILISPWAELWPRSTGSAKDNAELDYLKLGENVPLMFCSREEIESPYVNPLRGDAKFWDGVFGPNTVNIWGEHEVLKDTCREFGEVAGITKYFEEPHGLHDIMPFGVDNAATRFIVENLRSWLV